MYWISIRAPYQNLITIKYFHFIIKKVYGFLFSFKICHQKFLFYHYESLKRVKILKELLIHHNQT